MKSFNDSPSGESGSFYLENVIWLFSCLQNMIWKMLCAGDIQNRQSRIEIIEETFSCQLLFGYLLTYNKTHFAFQRFKKKIRKKLNIFQPPFLSDLFLSPLVLHHHFWLPYFFVEPLLFSATSPLFGPLFF